LAVKGSIPDLSRSLFQRGEPFFVVWGVDYAEQSAGRRALHYLCHILNKSGADAYITKVNTINGNLFTPMITPEQIQLLRGIGRPCVMIYPEIVSVDPIPNDQAVRWLLNRPGAFDSNFGGSFGDRDKDLCFYWSKEYLHADIEAWPLYIPLVDRSIFNNDENPHDNNRQGRCLFACKYLMDGFKIDEELLRSSVDLSFDYRTPRPVVPSGELASLFRRSEYLVSYEASLMTLEAQLCGCPVVYRLSEYMPDIPTRDLFGTYGIATSFSHEDISLAKASVSKVTELYLEKTRETETQVAKLIEICMSRFGKARADGRA